MARGGSPGGTRQRKHWAGSDTSQVQFTGAATGIVATLSLTDPLTILRTLGEVLIAPTGGGTFATADIAHVTFGLGVVSTDALAVGASAMPDPFDEADFDWLWWYHATLAYPLAGAFVGLASESVRVELATKAMRKIKGHGEALVLLAQYISISGNPPVDVTGAFRMLLGE